MPASAAFVPLARLQVASVASLLDCSVDEIDDLRLAVEELCLWALRQPRSSRGQLRVTIHWEEGFLDASCTLLEDGAPLETLGEESDELLDTLSMQILAAMAEEHGVSADGETRAWFRKKRASA
jgi:hypothetical protein